MHQGGQLTRMSLVWEPAVRGSDVKQNALTKPDISNIMLLMFFERGGIIFFLFLTFIHPRE